MMKARITSGKPIEKGESSPFVIACRLQAVVDDEGLEIRVGWVEVVSFRAGKAARIHLYHPVGIKAARFRDPQRLLNPFPEIRWRNAFCFTHLPAATSHNGPPFTELKECPASL